MKNKLKQVIQINPKEKLIFLFENHNSEQIKEFQQRISEFLKDKKQKFILIGGVKVEKITNSNKI